MVQLKPGIYYRGNGSRLLKTPAADEPEAELKWRRLWTTHATRALFTEKAAPIWIDGFVFDGNADNMQWSGGYAQEQAASLFLTGDHRTPGRLRAFIRDCVFENSVADGISVWVNCDVSIQNCYMRSCFRGGLVVTGGNTTVIASGLRIDESGIDVEIDGRGFGETYKVDITLSDSVIGGDFDIGVRDGSQVVVQNVVMTGPRFVLGMRESRGRFANCIFRTSVMEKNGNTIWEPFDLAFDNCVFEGTAGIGADDGAGPPAVLRVFWHANWQEPRVWQKLVFRGCSFDGDAGVIGRGDVVGLFVGADSALRENRVTLRDCEFREGLKTAIHQMRGGIVEMEGGRIDCAEAFRLEAAGDLPGVVRLRDVRLGRKVRTGWILPRNTTALEIDHDLRIAEEQNSIVAPQGLGHVRFRGRRVIEATRGPEPGDQVGGFMGDVWRTRIWEEIHEWVCVRSDPTAARWIPWR
jgi:hypothetical protein